MYLKDIFISSSFETSLSTDVGIQLHLNEYRKDVHTTKTNGGPKMYLKDIFISLSFETWLSIDEDTRMNVIEWRKDAHHQDWLWNNVVLEG